MCFVDRVEQVDKDKKITAKYSGTDRVDLIENKEYGYCSLIKATKRVIDKLELVNKTFSKITPKERIDKRLWNAVAKYLAKISLPQNA